MTDRLNKTSICSIVFLDIIDYSKKPVSEQIEDKNLFNDLINEAIKNVAQNDRIILDTGDGAAITLMGSPEEGLFIALTIRDGILEHNKTHGRNLRVRIGINLGSVRVVNDINNRPNIIGDGINVAQRIMSFADENQILVSRSYFEVTSRLTSEITDMFTYFGVKQDKHVREHEVYSIKAKAENEPMPEAQSAAPRGKPEEEVMLKDILKPSNLIIGLIASVLLILLGWYAFILKPALSENSAEMRFTAPVNQPLNNRDSTVNSAQAIGNQPAGNDLSRVDSGANQSQQTSADIRSESAEKKRSEAKKVAAKANNKTASNAESKNSSAAESFKKYFPPAKESTCTQAQLAMSQCRN